MTSTEARRALALASVEAGCSGPLVARALGDGAGAHAAAIDLAAGLLEHTAATHVSADATRR